MEAKILLILCLVGLTLSSPDEGIGAGYGAGFGAGLGAVIGAGLSSGWGSGVGNQAVPNTPSVPNAPAIQHGVSKKFKMMNTNLKHFNIKNIKTLLRITRVSNLNRTFYQSKEQNPCLCGHVYYKQIDRRHTVRLYSAQTDQHRQKVVIETSTPKIVIDKKRNEVLSEENIDVRLSTLLKKVNPYIRLARWDRPIEEKNIDVRLSTLLKKVDPYIRLARWDRPIGVYLLYWPCSWSIALASLPGTVPLHTTLQTAALFLIGAGLMRGAGCTINDMWDKDVDAQDKEDDARIGMKSTALTFGEHTKPALSGALGLSVTSLAVAGGAAGLDLPYYIALAMYTLHAGRQIYTLNPDNPSDCANKFKSNSMVGLIILLGIIGGGYKQYIENRRKNKGKENVEITKSCIFS
ncbi:4-hydroxybenzoate polyprenyltransferase, mitochondrial [Papilio machaon]|uniref:4-hydroxybenzoate polyprenyltransferase, mitochondrial n=1 Tax=Papilio machaon TaxID=76193 RepID=A0A0N1IQ19_PAPMA|nr:4-hydroxybenzoate polyprenyltransferase, mitochondrial [Papilio machaon]